MTSELTKRKAFALDGGTDVNSNGDSSSSVSALLSDKDGDVRVVEYDVRPSCAADAPRRYVQHGDHLTAVVHSMPVNPSLRTRLAACFSLRGITRELQEMFLPAGYPDSVSDDYLAFQCWDTIQAVCSYLRGVLATQSVLQSVGVGNDQATPLAAALQWVVRDGSGMIGGLTFAYFVGPKFDMNVKRWRLFADVINDVGLTLDMLAPLFPTALTTHVLCVSSICKTMCGVAAGATRSSLMTHFAKRDNMADCAAKEGSQETAVKLFGLVFGMYFANAVNASPTAVWIAFGVLTVVHVVANYNAVSGLSIPTLNRQRGLILIQRFVQVDNVKETKQTTALTSAERSEHFSIPSVNRKEPIYFDPTLPIDRIVMGSQLCRLTLTASALVALQQLFADERYLLCVESGTVHVLFRPDVTPRDELRAFYHAVVVLDALVASSSSSEEEALASGKMNMRGLQQALVVEHAYRRMCRDFAFFWQQLEASGWRTHMVLLNTSTWRIKLRDAND